ncbi:MAG TPA: DUF1501 domain-containing protein [Kofleriaceae bacterium]|nr:DUF1501 domain-containing protein [Kofleriaceae bacterium]
MKASQLRGLTRRGFLAAGAGAALFFDGKVRIKHVLGADPDLEQRFVSVYFNGAWDVLLGFDARDPSGTYAGIQLGTELLDPAYRTPVPVTVGGAETLWGAPAAALVRHADKATIFRGVNMNTVAHATGRAYTNSFLPPAGVVVRGSSIATLAAGVGPIAPDRVLPNVTIGLPSYNVSGAPELTATSLARATDIGGLLRPLTTPLPAEVEGLLATAQASATSCVSTKYAGPRPAEQLAAAHARTKMLLDEDVFSLFDVGNATDPAMIELRNHYGFPASAVTQDQTNPGLAAAVTAQLLRSGMSKAVTVAMLPSLDTHGSEWATTQPTRLEAAFGALAALLDDLREDDPGMTRTTVLVHSEFARTPMLNGQNGRDHHFANSLAVFGACLKGGLFGQTGPDNLGLMTIDLATGQPSDSGLVLLPEYVGATVIAAMGGDASIFRVPPIDSIIRRA